MSCAIKKVQVFLGFIKRENSIQEFRSLPKREKIEIGRVFLPFICRFLV